MEAQVLAFVAAGFAAGASVLSLLKKDTEAALSRAGLALLALAAGVGKL